MNKHTPEPWQVGWLNVKKYDNSRFLCIVENSTNDGDNNVRAVCLISAVESLDAQDDPNAHRIVACVNALNGIEDPEKWVSEMKAENERLRKSLLGEGWSLCSDCELIYKSNERCPDCSPMG